jgi:hypothetical protein
MTDDANKPPPGPEPTIAAPSADDGWDPPAADPIDPATGYAIHPADPAHPSNQPAAAASGPELPHDDPVGPPDPATGYVSYSSPAIDPVTGLPTPTHPDDDAPILPANYDAASLRGDPAATGGSTLPPPTPPKRIPRDGDGDDDDDPRKSSRRMGWIIGGSIVLGITIVTLAIFGHENAGHYYITCDADKIVATQGRGFPPWGSSALSGAEWKPIAISQNAECTPQDTENYDELEGSYLKALMDQASALLTAREVTKPDLAAEQLNQALLLARAESRRDQRKEIERLLGDVDYWRASTKLRDAANALGDAAKQFDAAAAQRPRHVGDAAAWASYIRKLVDQLHAGPSGGSQATFPPLPVGAERPPAPAGVALPVEPDKGTDVAPLAPPDAGTPSGGVLL